LEPHQCRASRSPSPRTASTRSPAKPSFTINGTDIYLGPHGTKSSKVEYDRIIAEYLAAGRRLPTATSEPTVNEIVLALWKHAKEYYRKPVLNPDGSQKIDAGGKPVTEPTTEVRNLKRVLRPLRRLYGDTLAQEVGPLALKRVPPAPDRPRLVSKVRQQQRRTGEAALQVGGCRRAGPAEHPPRTDRRDRS
jgi:hypothetical protein